MAEILSQDEIDSLLNTLSDDSTDSEGTSVSDAVVSSENSSNNSMFDENHFEENRPKNISLYDFRRPDRVSKDQLRVLQNIHENYIRVLSTTLTSILRSLVEIELLSVDQLTYQEFIMSVPNPSVLFTYEMPPFEGEAIFEINLELVYLIIEKLFGGSGNSSLPSRELSSLEIGVIKKIVKEALEAYHEIWEHLIDIKPKILNYESNPQFIQIIPGSEIVILITFEIRLQDEMSGMMSICLPYVLLEPVISDMSSQSWVQKKDESNNLSKDILKLIADREVETACQLFSHKIKLKDFLQLKNNDIIKANKPVDYLADLMVDGKEKFVGKFGVVGNKKALKIIKPIVKE